MWLKLKTIANHPFGNGLPAAPTYGDLGDGLLLLFQPQYGITILG